MTNAAANAALATIPDAAAAAAQGPTTTSSKNGPGVVKKTGGAWNIDPRTITIEDGWNIRFDMGDIDELARSIKAHYQRDPESGGLIHPLGVRRIGPTDPLAQGGKYHFAVVRGHRRTTAIGTLLAAGFEFEFGVPAKILDKGMDLMSATLEMFIENDQKPLLPLEEAAAFKRLREGDISEDPPVPGMTVAQISAATGRSDHHIISTLALLDADEDVVEALKAGDIKPTVARAIAKDARGDKARQKELVKVARANKDTKNKQAVRDGLHAAKVAKAAKKGKTLKMRALNDAQLSALGAKVGGYVVQRLKDAGKPADFDVEAWVREDDARALAFTFGALQALKAAAGAKVELSV